MERKKRKIKIGLILFAVLLILYVILINVLIEACLVPSFMRKLEVFETVTEQSYAEQVQTSDVKGNYSDLWTKTKEWFQEVDKQKIEITSEDGYRLVAAEFAPCDSISFTEERNDSGHKWALVLHGYTGWKEEMYVFARWYSEEGYHVVVPDLRCQGESEGDYIGMGLTDSRDCMLWIDYILEQDPDARIVLHGQSMGAAAALLMTGMDPAEYEKELAHIEAVVSDAAYTDAYSMFGDKITEWFHLPAFPLVDSTCLMLRIRGGYDLKKASPLMAVEKSHTPTLFIHGREDAMISVEMAQALYDAASCEKELLIVEGAGHAQTQDKDPDAYFSAIRQFLEDR